MKTKNNEKVNVSLKYTANLTESNGPEGNLFTGIPEDLKAFLENPEGIMYSIKSRLYPQSYKIEIKIKSKKRQQV
jgi:hypothetical protein